MNVTKNMLLSNLELVLCCIIRIQLFLSSSRFHFVASPKSRAKMPTAAVVRHTVRWSQAPSTQPLPQPECSRLPPSYSCARPLHLCPGHAGTGGFFMAESNNRDSSFLALSPNEMKINFKCENESQPRSDVLLLGVRGL
jgi:hypothetical protein